MRNEFARIISQLAEKDKNVIVITGDLGYGVLDTFWNTYPNQFINAGISEQNMAAVSAGMALEGKEVYMYSIANFPTLRCIENIRNDIIYHNANVKIISIGAGFAYGSAGMSHHATEELAIMRAMPSISIFSPADLLEARASILCAHDIEGPCYIRLGKGGEPLLHSNLASFEYGKAIKVKDVEDMVVLTTGAIASEAKMGIEELEERNVKCGLYSFPTIKPIDSDLIRMLADYCKVIITLEEHNIIGGLGSAVAEVMSEMNGKRARLVRMGLRETFSEVVGDQNYLRGYYGIDKDGVKDQILSCITT